METFKRGIIGRMQRALLAAAVMVCVLPGISSPVLAAESKASAPTPQEQAELAKFASYNGNIEVIAPNAENGLHAFLAGNAGKTVFIDSVVLRYEQAPEGVDESTRDQIPPTDRFENLAVKNCWGDEVNREGKLESGPDGWPIPIDQAELEAGCATRIKIEMTGGDQAHKLVTYSGFDKLEIVFAGFFEVKKEELANGKTLYRLSEVAQPAETAAAFFKHATKKNRELRNLGYEAASASAQETKSP